MTHTLIVAMGDDATGTTAIYGIVAVLVGVTVWQLKQSMTQNFRLANSALGEAAKAREQFDRLNIERSAAFKEAIKEERAYHQQGIERLMTEFQRANNSLSKGLEKNTDALKENQQALERILKDTVSLREMMAQEDRRTEAVETTLLEAIEGLTNRLKVQ